MTSLAFILGCVPLWIAGGAGAVGRQQLGTVVIMGMAFDTLFASLLIPVSFYAIERLSRWRETEQRVPVQPPLPATE
jgi:HAE1 family hydrophobic/amphiphilic exporter-1